MRIVRVLGVIVLFISLISCQTGGKPEFNPDQIDDYWQSGLTLPEEAARLYPLPEQPVTDDTGINVLLDLAHQCSFEMMWRLPASLMEQGFRVATSQATLHNVLDPGGYSRVRIQTDTVNDVYPFAWHPNFEYNVVVTQQSDMNAQPYMEEEIDALRDFVRDGGGLVILAGHQGGEGVDAWSMNDLAGAFGAEITGRRTTLQDVGFMVVSGDEHWTVLEECDQGYPVQIKAQYGDGHVVVGGNTTLRSNRQENDGEDNSHALIGDLIKRVSTGKPPVGGPARLPMTHAGGGGIYPELEQQMGDIVLFYAENQIPELLQTVEEDIPHALELVEGWLPSKPTLEPMYLILSAGGGGGWAVNAYSPKENGIISLDPFGILSIFAHELAHTMHGPPNARGEAAGITPYPFDNRGEAHAGWFQGKIDAIYDESRHDRANRNANAFFDFDPEGNELDLAGDFREEDGYEGGQEWTKSWYLWQKLDDRYGPTWYPRWRWVQHTRWKDEPQRRLSWEEMVEDMSIAVGEDLFPFFRKLGTSLEIDRLESTEFMGETMELEIAPLDLSPAGPVNTDPIGDYTEPLR